MTTRTRTEVEWDLRDELAAIFMQAIVTGRYAEGRDPAVEAKANARRAYDMAADFLAVRGEVSDVADDRGDGAEAEPAPGQD